MREPWPGLDITPRAEAAKLPPSLFRAGAVGSVGSKHGSAESVDSAQAVGTGLDHAFPCTWLGCPASNPPPRLSQALARGVSVRRAKLGIRTTESCRQTLRLLGSWSAG